MGMFKWFAFIIINQLIINYSLTLMLDYGKYNLKGVLVRTQLYYYNILYYIIIIIILLFRSGWFVRKPDSYRIFL